MKCTDPAMTVSDIITEQTHHPSYVRSGPDSYKQSRTDHPSRIPHSTVKCAGTRRKVRKMNFIEDLYVRVKTTLFCLDGFCEEIFFKNCRNAC